MIDTIQKVAELKEQGIEVYSYSRLSSLYNCLYEYKLGYIDKHKGMDNIWTKLGTLIHECVEMIYNGELDESEFESKYLLGYQEIINQGYKFPTEVIEENMQRNIQHYIYTFKKDDVKTENEKHFLVNISNIWLQGYIDKIVFNDDGTIDIYDYKTSSKFSAKDIKEKGRQLILYGYAMEQMGYKVRNVAWDMVKYVWTSYKQKNGFSKPVLTDRKDIWNKLQLKLLIFAEQEGYSKDEAYQLYLDLASDDRKELPDNLKDYFIIESGIVVYPYSEENIQDLIKFVEDSLDILNKEKDFKPNKIDKGNSFYCSFLCGQKSRCESYKQYVETLENKDVPELFKEQGGINSGVEVDFKEFFK